MPRTVFKKAQERAAVLFSAVIRLVGSAFANSEVEGRNDYYFCDK
jgi:hypothetical protein